MGRMKTFSIITPIYAYNPQKATELWRCIESVKNQSYGKKHIQHIIINDGSTVPLTIPRYRHLEIHSQTNMQRITAYNEGFKRAKNDVMLMLDADDELVPEALGVINSYYEEYPEYNMFNFGCIYIHKDGKRTKRDAFCPVEDPDGVGHVSFSGGNIVNGTFCFRRKIYEELGAFPENIIRNVDCTSINYPAGGDQYIRDLCMSTPYDFSAWFQLTYPETQQYFMVNVDDEPDKIIKEIGNPFGQDYALFYKYSRVYKSKPMEDFLEIVHIR